MKAKREKIYYPGSRAYKVVDENRKIVGFGGDGARDDLDKKPTAYEDNRPESDKDPMKDMMTRMLAEKDQGDPATPEEMQTAKQDANPLLQKYAEMLKKKKFEN